MTCLSQRKSILDGSFLSFGYIALAVERCVQQSSFAGIPSVATTAPCHYPFLETEHKPPRDASETGAN